MATDTIGVDQVARRRTPYEPSWLNRGLDWIQGRPWPAWRTYAVLAVVLVLGSNAQSWSSGSRPVGSLSVVDTYWGLFPVVLLWIIGHLQRVAHTSLDRFRQAIDASDAEIERLRWELTVAPARPALLVATAAIPLTIGSYLLDPVGTGIGTLGREGLVIRALLESFLGAVFLVMLYLLIRQLREVRRIVAMARIDLFQPGPLYAFSTLTSRFGISLVLLLGSSFLVSPPTAFTTETFVVWSPWVIGVPLLALGAFIVPLYGMHERLDGEKQRLQNEAESRLKDVLAELNRDVDERDLQRADALNKTLSSLLQQRDVLAKLPTWPWSAGTLRAFVSAILLPLVIFLLQRVLGSFV